jgi:hypothetical protein
MKSSLSFVLFVALLLTQCKSSQQNQSGGINITDNPQAQRVDIKIGGKPFTSYIYPNELKKPVLYPLLTAQGTPVTRGWPMDPRPGERVDHPHHVGMWFNYGDVNGHDFWNNSNDVGANAGPFGTIKHKAVTKIQSGNREAELHVTADWQKPDGTALLSESTRFIFSGDEDDRFIERITTLTALNQDVLFKDNKEGMIGIRLSRELEHPSNKPEIYTDASGKATPVAQLNNSGVTGKYRSSEGKEGDDVWGTRGKWVNLNGTIGNEQVSLVILDNPANVGYPTYWHARGYGLFAANTLGQNAMSGGKETLNYKLSAGQSVTFRYKVWIHSGSHLSDEEVNKAFDDFQKGGNR